MFKDISWEKYWMFILIILLVYYSTIGCLYYLNEIKQLFLSKSNLLLRLNGSKKFTNSNDNKIKNLDTETNAKDSDAASAIFISDENDLPSYVNEYLNRVNTLLKYASNNGIVKQELIFSLQQLAIKYSVIKESSFKSFITNYILTECNNYCSIHLDEDELKLIWA